MRTLFLIACSVAAGTSPVLAKAPSTDVIALPLNPIIPPKQRLCTAKTGTGLGYRVLKAATGASPGGDDMALVNYIGYLNATGVVFDQNMKSPLPVSGVIPGFAEGLKLMQKGSIYRFCIPARLGYAAKGAGASIPPNADLVFQVELVDFKSEAELEALREKEGTAQ